ncbi:ATP-binding protein [Rhodococcus qingshengii]|uniref:ATP-binding protein n=1 Tax=Rhodococcus TaxID=1827 RepID=UPI001BA5D832|nr:anti-sigma factor [Rhodococcus qingshengii]MBS3693928.1 anti-sigma factor [Rhodococcus qingshengii]
MTSSERAIVSPAAASPSLSVSATPDQLPVLRSLVRTVAAHYALSLDGLSDLVLAVDEAATILIGHALSSSTLTCAFDEDTEPAAVRVMLSTPTTGQITTSTSSFGWHVLEILVDGVVLDQVPPASPEQNWAATITLTKGLQAPT